MPKQKNVTDAEIIACHIAASDLLQEMRDFADRIEKGYVDRIDGPVDAAKQFALIAREATNLSVQLLSVDAMQKQKDEIAALRAKL